MELLYTYFAILASFTEYILAYYYLSVFVDIGTPKKVCTAAILAAVATVCVGISNLFIPFSGLSVLLIATYITCTTRLFFGGRFFLIFILYGYFFLYANMIDFLCVSVFGMLVGDKYLAGEMLQTPCLERILCILASKALLLFFTVLFRRLFSEAVMKSHQMLVSLLLGYVGLTYMWNLSFTSVDVSAALNWLLMFLLFLVVMFTVSWYTKYHDEKQEKELARLQNIMLQQTCQTLKEHSDEVRKLHHDLNNHMTVLLNLLDGSGSQKAHEYIERIGFQKSEHEAEVWTGNPTVDFLLNFKGKEARKQGISVTIHADSVAFDSIHDDDLCTIVANLLDNAIEACGRITDGSRWIQVSIRKMEAIVIIKIENSCASSPTVKGSWFPTTKHDTARHGFGIRNVQAAADRYGAVFASSYQDHVFTSSVTFFD